MILHLLIDDQFSDYAVKQFSPHDMKSDFVVVSPTRDFVYFHYSDRALIVNPYNEGEMNQLLAKAFNYKAIIFHGLFANWQEWLITRLHKTIKVAWVFYGGEVYGQRDLKYTFLAPKTKAIYWLREKLKKAKKTYLIPKNLLCNVDYCLTSEQEEYDFAKKYLKHDFKWLWYTYYTIEDVVGPLMNERCRGNSVWLGNAATIENNYIDIFLRIKQMGLGNNKLIVPLSYGTIWVKNLFSKIGGYLFKKQFKPLLDFLPRDQYNALMLGCSVMIQAHLRPHAHGNIITGLWLGMRIYLYERSMEFKFFKRIGAIIFSIEKDFTNDNENLLEPLTEEELQHNRITLNLHFGHKTINEKLKIIVNELNA